MVPRAEVDEWVEVDPALVTHLTTVAQQIGKAQVAAFSARRAGLMIAGYESPHLHVQVWPSTSLADFDLARVDNAPDPADLDDAAARLRAALRDLGHGEVVPQD